MRLLRLHLLRHGEPQPPGIFYGHSDVALSERGHAQVHDQAQALADVSLAGVWTSDLQRATIGARAIAGRADVTVSPALREMHLGVLEHMRIEDARARLPELAHLSFYDMLDRRIEGGGESVRDVAARVLPFVEARLQSLFEVESETEPASVDVALYAHNTVNRILLSAACGLDASGYVRFAQDYGALSRIDFEPQRMRGRDPWSAAAIAYANLPPRALRA